MSYVDLLGNAESVRSNRAATIIKQFSVGQNLTSVQQSTVNAGFDMAKTMTFIMG